jgi:hypothetical protein
MLGTGEVALLNAGRNGVYGEAGETGEAAVYLNSHAISVSGCVTNGAGTGARGAYLFKLATDDGCGFQAGEVLSLREFRGRLHERMGQYTQVPGDETLNSSSFSLLKSHGLGDRDIVRVDATYPAALGPIMVIQEAK